MDVQLACNTTIDYTDIIGDVILPFKFTLNEMDSKLTPAPGEYQKFCYDITGQGENTSDYIDLSHYVLGICPLITREQFLSISVVRDGVPIPIVWGENVELRTILNPDPPTGCVGLKIDIGLNKVFGFMKLCFELTQPYNIGPNNVCLFGGDATATGLAICGPSCEDTTSCESVFYQEERVCVPVTVHPYAIPGIPSTRCCGEPVVEAGKICPGTPGQVCEFTVSQTLCVRIPIMFGARITTGNVFVECGEASETECECTTS